MKSIKILLILIFSNIIFCLDAKAQTANDIAFNNSLNKALNSLDFIDLYKEYTSYTIIHSMMDLISQTCFKSAFNRPEEAIEKIDTLYSKYPLDFSHPYFINLFMSLKLAQLEKMAKWDECLKTLKILEMNCKNNPYLYNKQKYQALADLNLPQSEIICKSKRNFIKMTKEKVPGIKECWTIPVKANKETGTFIFDTGAGVNTISEKFAKRNNVTIIADSILTETAVSPVYSKLGFIDKLEIGNIEYKNILVYIIDFSFLDKNLGYEIDGVLGTPFMDAIGYIEVLPKKRIIKFPASIKYDTKQNAIPNMMYIANEQLYAEAYIDSLRLLVTLDTGNVCEGYINSSFMIKNADYLNKYISETDTVKIGGIKGIDTLYYNKVNAPTTIHDVTVESINYRGLKDKNTMGRFDGLLGIEFFNKCKRVTFDFRNMILSVEK